MQPPFWMNCTESLPFLRCHRSLDSVALDATRHRLPTSLRFRDWPMIPRRMSLAGLRNQHALTPAALWLGHQVFLSSVLGPIEAPWCPRKARQTGVPAGNCGSNGRSAVRGVGHLSRGVRGNEDRLLNGRFRFRKTVLPSDQSRLQRRRES